MDLDFGGPTVNATAVLGYGKWVAGTQLAFDTAGSKLTKTNFAIGHLGGGFEVNLFLNDGASFSLASRYAVDKDSSIATKINNDAQIGLSYAQN